MGLKLYKRVVNLFLLFLNYLFLISPCQHSRVCLQYRTILQINSQTPGLNFLNSLDFWWSKTVTLILLLSVVLSPLQSTLWHSALNSSLFVSICVLLNNPITVCGATSFPGYHSFLKWAIEAALAAAISPLVISPCSWMNEWNQAWPQHLEL